MGDKVACWHCRLGVGLRYQPAALLHWVQLANENWHLTQFVKVQATTVLEEGLGPKPEGKG